MPRSLPRLIDRYMNEEFNLGGEIVTRAELIRALKSDGLDDRSVDRYVQAVELRQRLRATRPAIVPGSSLLQ